MKDWPKKLNDIFKVALINTVYAYAASSANTGCQECNPQWDTEKPSKKLNQAQFVALVNVFI